MTRPVFCSIVDTAYLPRFLVMWEGLAAWTPDAQVYVLCMDEVADRVLRDMGLPGLELVGIDALRSFRPELQPATEGRTLVEVCWTVKPVLCAYLLDGFPKIDSLVYVDADLAFYADAAAVSSRDTAWSALIVPHRTPSGVTWERTHGIYNAGLVAFRRSPEAFAILAWWSERCLEWCFNRVEDGRFSDQKYLDDWPSRFRGVHALTAAGIGLAPWNGASVRVRQHPDDGLYADGDRLVFYHFQSLRLYRGFTLPSRLGLARRRYRIVRDATPIVWAVDRSYDVPPEQEALLYRPYIRALVAAIRTVEAAGASIEPSFVDLSVREALVEASRELLPTRVRALLRGARSRAPRRRRNSANGGSRRVGREVR